MVEDDIWSISVPIVIVLEGTLKRKFAALSITVLLTKGYTLAIETVTWWLGGIRCES